MKGTAIELPENFNAGDLKDLYFYTNSNQEYSVAINSINKLFYLSENYDLVDVSIESLEFPLYLNNSNPYSSILLIPVMLIFVSEKPKFCIKLSKYP